MTMARVLIILCSTLLLVTALVHSFLGEKKLLKPLLASRQGILSNELARLVLRFAWHLTSLGWLVLAVVLIVLVVRPDQVLDCTLLVTGVAFTLSGVFDAWATRGRHIGWPLLTAIGLSALMALASSR